MDENVMRVLQLLQDGKVSAQEAEALIAALRGESRSAASPEPEKKEEKEEKSFSFKFEKIKARKIDLDDLGERISKAVSRIEPEKIVKRVQSQIRTATRTGAHWGATVTARVRTWTEGDDVRPTNETHQPEHSYTHEQEFHLDSDASVFVENPLGDVKITGISEGPGSLIVKKTAWGMREEEAKANADKITVDTHGTDSRLDVKASAPDYFREGAVDLELRVPKQVNVRVSTHFGNVEIAQVAGRSEATTTSGGLKLLDLSGDARAETASGDLTLERIEGTATVATQSGDISATDIKRGLSANTASGDVTASNVEGGRIETKSVSGDVKVEHVGKLAPLDIVVESVSGDSTLADATGNIALKAVSGDIKGTELTATRLQTQTVSGDIHAALREPFSGTLQVNTVSGDVVLALPEGSNVRVSLSTTSGELRCEHDAQNVTATDTLWNGQLGTGAGTLNVQSISGDTHIRRA